MVYGDNQANGSSVCSVQGVNNICSRNLNLEKIKKK